MINPQWISVYHTVKRFRKVGEKTKMDKFIWSLGRIVFLFFEKILLKDSGYPLFYSKFKRFNNFIEIKNHFN